MALTGTGEGVDLISRYTGPGDENYYFGSLYNTGSGIEAYLYSNVNGNPNLLAYQLLSVNSAISGTLILTTLGNSLSLSFNGSVLFSVENTAISGPGSVGIRSTNGASISNFAALVPTSGLPFSDTFGSGLQLPFTDNFTTPTSPVPNQLDSNWINQVGNFTVNTSTGTASGSDTVNLATLTDLAVANTTVQANVTVTATGQVAALVSRYTGNGDQNFYLGGVVNEGSGFYQAFLESNVNEVVTVLASQQVAADSGTLTLVTSGSSLTLSYGGSVLFSITNSALSGAVGSVGLYTTAGATVQHFSVSVPTSGLPFSDNFSSGTQLNSANWTTEVGAFSVSNSKAVGVDSANLATVIGVNATNGAVQANIALTNGEYAGLMADFTANGYYYGVIIATGPDSYTAQIYLQLNGVSTLLYSQNLTGSPNGTLRFEAYGSSLELFLNGTLVAYDIDSTLSGGSVGMQTSASAAVSSFSANP